MTNEEFQRWLAGVEQLTVAQRERLQQVAQEQGDEAASLAAIELRVDERRRCPRCGAGGAVRRGCAHRLRRYACKACRRTFHALTGTPLAGPLAGLVEADETCFRHSRKGERNLNRKPRRRGGPARRRGLSREPVPVRVATARGGGTAGAVLETASQPSPRACLLASLAPQCTRFAN